MGLKVMNKLERGMIIDVNLEPKKGSETGKIRGKLEDEIIIKINESLKIVFAL